MVHSSDNPAPPGRREEATASIVRGAPSPAPRRLIVNADDFGRSHSINLAVARAHDDGILTSASLMVNETGFEEAVDLARQRPRLGVGLHLTLICGRAALSPEQIPGLVDAQQRFTDNPVAAGFRYYFNRTLRPQLEAEIEAQFRKFRATGLRLDHVNGHLHLHLHPAVFRILRARATEWGLTHLRLTCEPFWMNTRLARGRWLYRISHALIGRRLSAGARGDLRRLGIRHTHRVFGLLQDAHVDEGYVLGLLRALPPGDSELYSHPSLDQFRHELDALVSPRVQALVQSLGIALIRYQDL
jgi:hopanoid biosynthesis associated protein HpnK